MLTPRHTAAILSRSASDLELFLKLRDAPRLLCIALLGEL
tara:strand:+ start:2354 stop:2473 length:120 start_codon:yes stop_codon:yes gene_type:complete